VRREARDQEESDDGEAAHRIARIG
jgi:hypothetical protein